MDSKVDTIISELESYSKELDQECINYWNYHKNRYVCFIGMFKDLIETNTFEEKLRILDIAPLY